jgi:hypothetical protein
MNPTCTHCGAKLLPQSPNDAIMGLRQYDCGTVEGTPQAAVIYHAAIRRSHRCLEAEVAALKARLANPIDFTPGIDIHTAFTGNRIAVNPEQAQGRVDARRIANAVIALQLLTPEQRRDVFAPYCNYCGAPIPGGLCSCLRAED